jgi:inosose dehydratase
VAGGARAGGAPSASSSAPDEAFLRICDECSQLGLRYLEFNTTNRRLVDTWDNRISQFRDEMAKRNLTLLGLAVYSHMHRPELRKELIDQHLRVARFLKAVGGRYITQLVAPGERLANGEDEEYRRIDVKAYAANVNEVARRLWDDTGIRIGYHPEQGDIRAGIHERIVESTDSRYFDFVPDVGHIAASGLDPLPVYKKYRSRMISTHLKDYSPDAEYERNGQKLRGRMVPFGQGVVKMPALIQYLRDSKFSGHVMGEGGGTNQAMRDYMVETLRLKL